MPSLDARAAVCSLIPGAWQTRPRKLILKLQLPGHEDAIRIVNITDERPAVFETELCVKPARWFERIRGSRFQAQAAILPPPRFANDVLEKTGRNSLSQMSRSSSHGFDLRMFLIQFLEGTASSQFLPLPHAPKCNLRFA